MSSTLVVLPLADMLGPFYAMPNPATKSYAPGQFEAEEHFYERVLNAQMHPLVRHFLQLGNQRIAERYAHLHPEAHRSGIDVILSTMTRHFRWGGADLFLTASETGQRRMVVIETNSSPSGQKSMPTRDDGNEHGGYRTLLEGSLLPMLDDKRRMLSGDLAVLWDKNLLEASGYAATLADLTGEKVWLVPCQDSSHHRFVDGVLEVAAHGEWRPVRAAMRYVTQKPWDRIPAVSRSIIFNPVIACLAGGRNKAVAAKAYDLYNARVREHGLRLHMPETIWDVSRKEIPLWVDRMGGIAVIKNPYSNAGQGVYTVTSKAELDAFMHTEQHYDRFVVQSLIGNLNWSSHGRDGRLYHVGTIPDKRGRIFAADVRFMVGSGPNGFFPVAMYARRARLPLEATLTSEMTSWSMLGTNLSSRKDDGGWVTDTGRLLLMDNRDFNRLGLGIDDLIEAYVQTVMAVIAIDQMAIQLTTAKGTFRRRFFQTLNPDPALIAEIMPGVSRSMTIPPPETEA